MSLTKTKQNKHQPPPKTTKKKPPKTKTKICLSAGKFHQLVASLASCHAVISCSFWESSPKVLESNLGQGLCYTDNKMSTEKI